MGRLKLKSVLLLSFHKSSQTLVLGEGRVCSSMHDEEVQRW